MIKTAYIIGQIFLNFFVEKGLLLFCLQRKKKRSNYAIRVIKINKNIINIYVENSFLQVVLKNFFFTFYQTKASYFIKIEFSI